jgi:hypothetical protein
MEFAAPCVAILLAAQLAACGTMGGQRDLRAGAGESAQVILDLEARFAAASRERGARAAFLEFLADDSVVLQPGPVAGRATWESADEIAGTLDWSPDWAELAADGALGFATGPWLLVPPGDGPRVEGRYLTLWRRSDSGWAVAFDGGFARRAPDDATLAATQPRMGVAACGEDPEGSPAELQSLDRSLAGTADAPYGSQVLAVLGTGAVLFHPPVVGGFRDSVAQKAALDALPAGTQLQPMGAAVAASGDLGYSYGISSPAAGVPADASYVHVWCHAGGNWVLLLEVRTRLPAS